MLKKINPTYVYVAIVMLLVITMVASLIGGGNSYIEGWNAF